jgi:ribosome-associated protein
MMDIRKLQRTIVDALEDIKAQDIRVFNTSKLSDLFDRVIIASGNSNRQTRALASSVSEKVKDAGGSIVSIEGADAGDWVLVDCGDAVVHVMQPAVRAYYKLEEIWGLKPVHLKPVQLKSVHLKSATGKSIAKVEARVSKQPRAKPARHA